MVKIKDVPWLIYDGDCSFCRLWIERWKDITGGEVRYEPFQEVADSFPEIPRENFVKSVQFIMPNGQVFNGAEAVFRSLSFAPGSRGRMLWLYRNVPGVRPITEWFYRFVADHRSGLYKITVFLWGEKS